MADETRWRLELAAVPNEHLEEWPEQWPEATTEPEDEHADDHIEPLDDDEDARFLSPFDTRRIEVEQRRGRAFTEERGAD